MFPEQRQPRAKDKPAPPGLATIPEETIRAAFAKADAGEIPADKLLAFMRKYPPILWKDKPGSAKLLEQCRNAVDDRPRGITPLLHPHRPL